MEDAGIIEWEGDTIELTEEAKHLNVYLDIVPENSMPWGMYYLWLSVISAGMLGLAWVDLMPGSVPDLGWAGVAVALFAISAAVHTYQTRKLKLGSTEGPPGVD